MVFVSQYRPWPGLVHFAFFRHRRCCAVDISRGKNGSGPGDHEPPGGVPDYGKVCGMEPPPSVRRTHVPRAVMGGNPGLRAFVPVPRARLVAR